MRQHVVLRSVGFWFGVGFWFRTDRCKVDLIAESDQPFNKSAAECALVQAIEVVASQLLIRALSFLQIVRHDKHRVGHSNDGPFLALAHNHALVLGRPISVLGAGGREGRFTARAGRPFH
jgi:hypothetical protein